MSIAQIKNSLFILSTLLFTFLFASATYGDQKPKISNCVSLLLPIKSEPPPHQRIAYNQDSLFYDSLAKKIEQNRDKFASILSSVDSVEGTEYEINQAIKTLRGVRLEELSDLREIEKLKRVAVFGSTNLPLYSLILHAVIPASTGAEVWYHSPDESVAIYLKLAGLIRTLMPEFDLTGLQIISNQSGRDENHFLVDYAAKSDMIIYNGDQSKSDALIDRLKAQLVSELKKTPAAEPSQIVFLKFGAGLNPVILTENGTRQLSAAVDSAVQALRINSAQDAIAPKFYMVHESQSDTFVSQLKKKMARLKLDTHDTDLSTAFREKWKRYCIAQDLGIFVFPFSKFNDVEILDHNAPFLVIFRYDDEKDLEAMASDPRVRSRALFASIFSNPGETEITDLRKLFEDNFHSVILNQTAYATVNGNFPFGGYSGDVSRATLIQRAQDKVQTVSFDRPLLFSREAKNYFGRKKARAPYAQLMTAAAEPENLRLLNEMIVAAQDPKTVKTLPADWRELKEPEMNVRPTGLFALREAIREGGLHIAVDEDSPTTGRKNNADSFLYGADVLYGGRSVKQQIEHVPGLVLHFTETTREVLLLNQIRGDLNPHLGFGYLRKLVETKYGEYALANAIWPGSMPGSIRYTQLESSPDYTQLESSRKKLLSRLNKLAKSNSALSLADKNDLIDAIAAHVQIFFDTANNIYAHGAFIKNYEEASTGDLGNAITTFSDNARNYAVQFVDRFIMGRRGNSRGRFSSEPFINYILKNGYYETGSKMILRLLTDPSELLIQQRVRIAKTDFGFPMEFRVDFLDGVAINSTPRYTNEYLANEAREAAEVLDQFFARAPSEVKMLSGGADLVKLENGRWAFMEFNIGSESGFMDSSASPIDGNFFISNLQGKKTPVLEWLDKVFDSTLKAQRELLSRRKYEKFETFDKVSANDISMAEIAQYFRDRYIEEWQKEPTAKKAEWTLKRLRALFKDIGSEDNHDLPLLLKSAENYMNRELLRHP